jgi:hypothetical protein
MSTDEASFIASITPQSVDEASPYTEKNFNFISDINSNVYSGANSGLTQVNYDLSSLYNSNLLVNAEDCFLAIPIVTCAQYINDGAVRAPPGAGHSLVTLKNGFHHLVHQADITSGGVTIQESQPFLNVIKHFKLISQMSATDLKQSSASYGMSDVLDGTESQKWFTVAGKAGDGTTNATCTLPGIGLTNNQAFLNATELPTVTGSSYVGPSSYSGQHQTVAGVKGAYTVNEALQKRSTRLSSALTASTNTLPLATGSNVAGSNIYGATAAASGSQPFIMSANELNTEFKSYYTVTGNTMVWYDLAYIKCSVLFGAFETMGLSRKLDLQMRLWLNSGSLQVPVTISTLGFAQYGAVVSNTFNYTCPFTVNTLPIVASVTGTLTDGFYTNAALGTSTTGYLAVGCFPVKAPTTSIGALNVNFGAIGISHSMSSTRFYYSQIKMSPERTLKYITENRAKRCLFQSYIFNQYNSVPANGTFASLIQSGIRNPLALVCIPLISSSQTTLVSGTNALGFSQYQSPYDTCPATTSPISLTNFQVSIGGQAVFKSGPMQYSWENFVENVQLADSVVPGLSPASCGIFTQQFWEASRVYWCDLSRAENADKASQRNLTLSFRNNSLVTCDILVFTLYSTEILLDVETGRTQLL